MSAVPAVARADATAGPSLRLLATVVLTVFCAVLVGVGVSWVRGTLSPVWIGTAVMVYWLMRTPRRDWPSIVAVCWLANVAASIAMGRWMPRAILLPTVNLLEAVLITVPLRMYKLDDDFARPLTLAAFYALVLGPATMIAACITATGIEAFEPWPSTTRVIVSADRDEASNNGRPGTRQGETAARKFAAQGTFSPGGTPRVTC